MSTPPPYPFRSRREIHSGEPKVYSDADLHDQQASAEPTPEPVQGIDATQEGATCDPTTPVRGVTRTQRPLPSFDEITDSGETSRVSRASRQRSGQSQAEVPSETTGMRSRRLASERRAARKRKRQRRVRSFFIILLVLGLVGGASYVAYDQLVNSSVTASDDFPGPGSGSVEVQRDRRASCRERV